MSILVLKGILVYAWLLKMWSRLQFECRTLVVQYPASRGRHRPAARPGISSHFRVVAAREFVLPARIARRSREPENPRAFVIGIKFENHHREDEALERSEIENRDKLRPSLGRRLRTVET
jgi:hypothetical protein